MSKSEKVGLSRRLMRQYSAILNGNGSVYFLWPSLGCNGQAALIFAKTYGQRRGVDVKRLQGPVLGTANPKFLIEFARDVRGANVKRFQRRVIELGDPSAMRRFARSVPGAEIQRLEAYALVAEIMNV
jgi:hypothetical protein